MTGQGLTSSDLGHDNIGLFYLNLLHLVGT